MRRRFSPLPLVSCVVLPCLLLLVGCDRFLGTPGPSTTPSPVITASATQPLSIATNTPEIVPTATASLQPPTTVTPTPSGRITLRVGSLQLPALPQPMAAGRIPSDGLTYLLYDTLIYPALDGTYAPSLARTWSSQDGGKTWILVLQPEVTTHDGQPLGAQDVAFTLDLYQGHPNFLEYGGDASPIETVEATSPETIQITMARPLGNIEAFLHWIPILPEHVWEGLAPSPAIEISGTLAVGSGPFQWLEYVPGQLLRLAANKNYWMGAPVVDELVFQVYADANALVDALVNGEVDLITDVPLERLISLRSESSVQVVSGPGRELQCLALNVSQEEQSSGHPALRDPQLRIAIAHAIDRQQLIDLVLLGRGMPGLSILPPTLRNWFNAEIEDVSFDLALAQQLLDNAGYRDNDEDGVREMPGTGQPLEFRLLIPAGQTAAAHEADLLANWLAQIGIDIEIEPLESAAFKEACCPAFDYDLLLARLSAPPDPGPVLRVLTTEAIVSGMNQSGYSNPAYDALYDQQRLAVDQSQRRDIVFQMQQIAFNDRPCVVLYYDVKVQAFRKDRFTNWLYVLNGALSLADPRSLLQVEPVP